MKSLFLIVILVISPSSPLYQKHILGPSDGRQDSGPREGPVPNPNPWIVNGPTPGMGPVPNPDLVPWMGQGQTPGIRSVSNPNLVPWTGQGQTPGMRPVPNPNLISWMVQAQTPGIGSVPNPNLVSWMGQGQSPGMGPVLNSNLLPTGQAPVRGITTERGPGPWIDGQPVPFRPRDRNTWFYPIATYNPPNTNLASNTSNTTITTESPKPTSNGLTIVVESCEAACLTVTSELNLVCGTNNKTYDSIGKLECARECGVDVQLKSKGQCGQSSSTPTTDSVNGNGHGGVHIAIREDIACMQLCPVTSEINPVCGTDGVTYANPGWLLCFQFCGHDVKIRQFASCLDKPVPNQHPFVCPILPTPTNTSSPTKVDCANKCSASQVEYEPVCGSDNLTYINLDSLLCQKKCGVDVSVKSMTSCETNDGQKDVDTAETENAPDFTLAPNIMQQVFFTDVSVKNMTSCETNDGQKDVDTAETENGLDFTIAPNIMQQVFFTDVSVKNMTSCETNDGQKDVDTAETENRPDFTIAPNIMQQVFFTDVSVKNMTSCETNDGQKDVDTAETENGLDFTIAPNIMQQVFFTDVSVKNMTSCETNDGQKDVDTAETKNRPDFTIAPNIMQQVFFTDVSVKNMTSCETNDGQKDVDTAETENAPDFTIAPNIMQQVFYDDLRMK